jgi:aminomuconate-semialdehyde/2-hydroxymuconate-6-semialdehyde dehydrogenase
MLITSYINGEFYKSGDAFAKQNPFTGEALHDVRSCDLMGLVLAIKGAHQSGLEWAQSSIQQRREFLNRLKQQLKIKQNEYARLEALDQGLPFEFVLQSSLEPVLTLIENLLAEEPASSEIHSPTGVVALIGSWNLSLRNLLDRLLPALLGGNSVVVKVSSVSPVTAGILADLLQSTQTPKGLVQVLVSSDHSLTQTLVAHPGVHAVSVCCRSENSGIFIAGANQGNLQSFKKLQLAGGSKNSAVALAEPTPELVESVMKSFLNGQGQLAWNSARLFVLEKFEIQWGEAIQSYLSDLRPSEGIEDASLWGPCLKPESFDKFSEISHLAVEDKAKLMKADFALSKSQSGFYLPPVFTRDMSRCSTLQQDQIHAPFFILSAVKYPFGVAKYSNVSYFGFAAHIWGEPEKNRKIASALDVGLVAMNGYSVQTAGAWASVKQSGFGIQDYRAFGAFFSNVKKIAL